MANMHGLQCLGLCQDYLYPHINKAHCISCQHNNHLGHHCILVDQYQQQALSFVGSPSYALLEALVQTLHVMTCGAIEVVSHTLSSSVVLQ